MHSTAVDDVLRALADTVAQVVAERVIAALRVPAAAHDPIFMKVPAYAERIGVSERHAWKLAKEGLPTIGEGRARRVDVVRADEWLRARSAATSDDSIERRARADARRSAARGTPT